MVYDVHTYTAFFDDKFDKDFHFYYKHYKHYKKVLNF